MPWARKAANDWPAVPVGCTRAVPRGGSSPYSRAMAPERGAGGPVRVVDLVGQLDVVAVPHRPEGVGQQLVTQLGPWVLQLDPLDEAPGGSSAAGGLEQRAEVHDVGLVVAGDALAQQVDAADGVVHRPQAQLGQVAPHLVGDEQEVRRHAFGRAP